MRPHEKVPCEGVHPDGGLGGGQSGRGRVSAVGESTLTTYVMRKKETMATPVHPCSYTASTAPAPTAIHTTLYDLIAALSAEVGPDEDDVLTAVVVHLLHTHRVSYTSDLESYRLVCDEAEHSAWSGLCDEARSLSYERKHPRG